MFSHARFSSFRCSISLMSVSSIQIFFVKSSYFIALFTRRSKAASRRSPKLINLFSSHAHTVIIFSTTFSILSFKASITFNMRILNHRLTRKSRVNFIFFFFFLFAHLARNMLCGAGPAERGYVNYFLFALPTHEVFKVVPFSSFIVVDVVLLAASATSAGNQFSVGLKNLFASNVHISHNWKQYSTVSENCNTLFQFFLLFFSS